MRIRRRSPGDARYLVPLPAQSHRTPVDPALAEHDPIAPASSKRRRSFCLAAWALLFVGGAVAGRGLEIDTSADLFLDRDSEAYAFYRESKGLFGGDETIVVTVDVEGDDPTEAVAAAGAITRELRTQRGIRRVDSIHTFPVVRAEPDGGLDLSAAAAGGRSAAEAVAEALDDRIFPRHLISEDGRTLAVVGMLKPDFSDFDTLTDKTYRIAAPYGGLVSGVPVFRTEANRRTLADLILYVPLCVVAIVLIAVAVFRRASTAVLALVPGTVGSTALAAAASLMGIPLNLLSVTVPAIVLALGAAYSMHLLAAPAAQPVAVRAAQVRRATLLSGLTTAIAFLSVATVKIEAISQLGILGAIGAVAATAATVSLLPALLTLTRPSSAEALNEGPGRAARLATTLTGWGHSTRPVWIWLLLALPLGVSLASLEIRTDVIAWFPEQSEVRQEYQKIKRRLSGISPVNIVISSESDRRVTEPEVVAAIDTLAATLEAEPDVGKAVSLADPLRQIHGGFVGDPTDPLPEAQSLIEQYLLFLESKDAMRDVITVDRAHANVVLHVDDNRSSAIAAVAARAENWWRHSGVEGFRARATGIMYEFARAEDAITIGVLQGTLAAVLAISLVSLLAYRSFRIAAVAMVPNLLPIAVVGGFLAAIGGHLDAGTAVVGCLALGIAVDDTFHVIDRYLHSGETSTAGRIREALARTLPALATSTALIAGGFLVLAISDFALTRNLGLLTAVAVVACLVADLTLLPSLLQRWCPDARAKHRVGAARLAGASVSGARDRN